MKAVITGSSGYIGGHIQSKLTQLGWTVGTITRGMSIAEMSNVLEQIQPNVVFHLASLFIAEHKSDEVRGLIESNLLFGSYLAEAMLKTGVRRLVNTGTSWQNFGPRGDEPVCLYAATKSAFEEILRYYVAAENFKVLNLRIYDTFGPDDQRPKLIPKLLKCFETQQALELSPGEQKLDFVHIDDVVNGFLRAGELLDSDKSEAGYLRSYGLSSGDLVSLRELISILERAKGQKLNVKWGARPYRKREVMMPFEGLERLPGWAATRKLEESLQELIRAAE